MSHFRHKFDDELLTSVAEEAAERVLDGWWMNHRPMPPDFWEWARDSRREFLAFRRAIDKEFAEQ
ncbi:MAG: hypothetical protein ACOC8H_00815 [bacterium]